MIFRWIIYSASKSSFNFGQFIFLIEINKLRDLRRRCIKKGTLLINYLFVAFKFFFFFLNASTLQSWFCVFKQQINKENDISLKYKTYHYNRVLRNHFEDTNILYFIKFNIHPLLLILSVKLNIMSNSIFLYLSL